MSLKYVLIGAGLRGQAYSEAAFKEHGCEIVAVADPNENVRNYIRDTYNVPHDMCFESYEQVLKLGKIADFAMICTQDKMHMLPAMMAIEQGYDILFWGNVPAGAGLSSSAAMEVVTAYALNELLGTGYDRTELAKIGQKAEHE